MSTSNLELETELQNNKLKCLLLFISYLWWCKENKPVQYLFLTSYLQSKLTGPIGPYLELVARIIYTTNTTNTKKVIKELTLEEKVQELYTWSQKFNKK